jgi:hypothetical protein
MQLGQVIWCLHCSAGYAVGGVLPHICPFCEQPARWTTIQPYHVSSNDAKFLKSIRIDPEVTTSS